uniref:uncharacterized protein LOC120334870 isoform X1 n=1 Tax=Styela clava TaxID=7725 RepID=UPI00193A3816|nr:uncharacterized protein LOC120334870 isoform X1 [Styela clava]
MSESEIGKVVDLENGEDGSNDPLLADIKLQDSLSQLKLRNQEENVVANTTPSENTVTVKGGNFIQPQLGPQYNEFKKQDGVIDSNFQGANFGTQNIKHVHNIHIFQNSQGSSDKNAKPTHSNNAKQVAEDWVQLSNTIGMFSSKKISKYGSVYEGAITSDICEPKPVAIKYSEYNETNVKEAKLLDKLPPHENVVTMYHCDIHCQGPMKYMYIAMELCHKESLGEYIHTQRDNGLPFNAKLSISYSKMVVDGLDFIHRHEIIHRDLKPENILLSRDCSVLKICDFGLSKQLDKGRSFTKQTMLRLGTDGYRAPETYNSGDISQHADIYSLALVIYFIWSYGEHPFGDDPDDWNSNIKRNKNRNFDRLQLYEKVTATKLLESMLEFEPKSRPTTEIILKNMIWYDTQPTYGMAPQSLTQQIVPRQEEPSVKHETKMSETTEVQHIMYDNNIGKYYKCSEEKKFLEFVEEAYNCKIWSAFSIDAKCQKISASFGPVIVSIYEGDILNESSDVIVSSKGVIEESITRKVGKQLKEVLCLAPKPITITTSGTLPCKKIVHTVIPLSLADLPGRIFDILEEVERLGHESVSLPAIGTGYAGLTFSEYAEAVRKTLLNVSLTGTYWHHLSTINIVLLHENDVRLVQDIIFSKNEEKSGSEKIDSTSFLFKSTDISRIHKAIRFLVDERHKRLAKFWIYNDSLLHLSPDTKEKINKAGKQNNVKIVIAYRLKNTMLLEGQAKNVMKVHKVIKEKLGKTISRGGSFRRNALTSKTSKELQEM